MAESDRDNSVALFYWKELTCAIIRQINKSGFLGVKT